MPRKQPQITISVTPAERDALHEAAQSREYSSTSEMIRQIVFKALGIPQETIERGKYERTKGIEG